MGDGSGVAVHSCETPHCGFMGSCGGRERRKLRRSDRRWSQVVVAHTVEQRLERLEPGRPAGGVDARHSVEQ